MPLLVRFTVSYCDEGLYIDVRDVSSVIYLTDDALDDPRSKGNTTCIMTYRGMSYFVIDKPDAVAAKIRDAIRQRDMGMEVGDD